MIIKNKPNNSPNIIGTSTSSEGIGIYNSKNSKGKIWIYANGRISGTSESGPAYGIKNLGATEVNITGNNTYKTTIIATAATTAEGTGIYNGVGTLKLWNTDDLITSINQNYPSVSGSTYGVNALTDSVFQFYDGKIIGATDKALRGVTPTITNGTQVTKTNENSKQIAIITL